MARLYLKSGYLNIARILSTPAPFLFVVGGRGTGKTYGALSYCLDSGRKFLFLRRTQSQADIISKPEFSPFKKIADDRGILITMSSITKYNSAFYHGEINDKGRVAPAGAPIGYTAALSTFSNVRGFDASDVDLIIYDEFIPERHERPIKNEFEALMNCYETVNRNRELNGKKPVQLLCLANANDISNPIFMGLKLIKPAADMVKKGNEERIDVRRGIGLWVLQHSPISEEKSETALYRLNGDNEFSRMAIGNEFAANSPSTIRSNNVKELYPLVAVGEICVYRHKSRDIYYVTTHISGGPDIFGATETDIKRFRHKYLWLKMPYLGGRIEFEEYLCEALFTKYLGV